MKDESVIPSGSYCYRVVEIKPAEVLSMNIHRFGKDLREFPHHKGQKQVLCPYWRKTDYGTVRCEFLEIEQLDDDEPDARDMAVTYFGSEDAFKKMVGGGYLYDEIKKCGIKEFEDED